MNREGGIVLFACESLFLRSGDNLTIAYDGGGAVVVVSGDAKDSHQS